jgi:hypothetical protein
MANLLLDHGFFVRHPIPKFVDKHEDEMRPGDEPDLVIAKGRLEIGLEIKAKRRVRFTSPSDFPFVNAYVGPVSRWAQRTDDPAMVIIHSEPTGRSVVAPVHFRRFWETRNLGPDGPCVAIPRDCLRSWEWFVDWLHAA